MKFSTCELNGIIIIEPDVFKDSRGFFMESWHLQKFSDAGIKARFVQQNHSRSTFGTLRGLHYQLKQAQGKLVCVTRGEVFDVAVDLRRSSSTFGKWHGEILSEENFKMVYVPPGFAHGFLVLSEIADFIYSCTDFYNKADEHTIAWNDPQIGIEWPVPEGVELVLSAKDLDAGSFADAEVFE